MFSFGAPSPTVIKEYRAKTVKSVVVPFPPETQSIDWGKDLAP